MTGELKPCPCCSWKRPDLREGQQRKETPGVYLWCSSCGLMTRLFTYDPIIASGKAIATEQCFEAWNRRASPPPTTTPEVRALVIAAREAWEKDCVSGDDLDKALEPFAAIVPYENEPTPVDDRRKGDEQ